MKRLRDRLASFLFARKVKKDPERVARLRRPPKSSGRKMTRDEFRAKYLR